MGKTTTRSAFLAGRDLAAAMLDTALAKGADAEESAYFLEKEDRELVPQDNFVVPFLEKLRSEPELMDGFAGVLSDYLAGCSIGFNASGQSYQRLTYNEMR